MFVAVGVGVLVAVGVGVFVAVVVGVFDAVAVVDDRLSNVAEFPFTGVVSETGATFSCSHPENKAVVNKQIKSALKKQFFFLLLILIFICHPLFLGRFLNPCYFSCQKKF